ncbi:MAG TPA: alpha/beta fold hydrolase [Gemmatimonadaceae bacterium]|nr:alpha/beta fold hydrolase [Gemmatimonadaceae bacterium]
MRRPRRSRAALQLAMLAAVAACGPVHVAELPPAHGETVVLLHGLARSSASMSRMARSLASAGYHVCNIDYPSRRHSIATLASTHVAPQVAACAPPGEPVHFVTHSLGGIVVRQLVASGAVPTVGRVVMLGPPNGGSEVVDAIGDWRLFRAVNGPAGLELGTADSATPHRLGRASFPVGVIAGTRSVNWILSRLIPGPDDGKVAVRRARLEGMRDFAEVGASHPFLMNDREAIAMTLRFLAFECFRCETSRLVPLTR